MYVLMMNTGDNESLGITFCGMFETHDEAHAEMVELIERHRDDWGAEYKASPDVFTVEGKEDAGHLIDGDLYDWRYYEQYFIFDTEDFGQTFVY